MMIFSMLAFPRAKKNTTVLYDGRIYKLIMVYNITIMGERQWGAHGRLLAFDDIDFEQIQLGSLLLTNHQ